MTRVRLPDRRPSVTVATEWQGMPLTVTIGFDLCGVPREVFADAPGGVGNIVSDAATVISIALQHGVTPAALAKSLGRMPVLGGPGETAASPVGAIVEVLL
jgi:hypothetical protein